MPVYLDKEKGRWRFEFNRVIRGQRTRYTKLLPRAWDRAKAEKYDRQETARIYAIATGVERPEPRIGQAVRLYVEHNERRKLRSRRKIEQDLAQLVEHIDGRPMSALPDVARQYAKDNPDLSDGTLHNRLAYLKAACRYAWRKHKLTELDPTGTMEIPKPNNRRDVQLPAQRIHELLLAIEDTEARALFTLAFRTGSRWIKGIHPRRPGDVSRVGRDVWLRIGITKNGTPRMKWVHPDARWALRHLPFKHGPEYYYDRFCAARAAVGLPDTWAHDMRHVLATDIVNRGGSLPDVSAALDHLSLASSERYAHITPPHVKRALQGVTASKKIHTAPRRNKKRKAA